MALTAEEQELFDIARAALPHWFFDNERACEELGQSAKVIGAARTQVVDWLAKTNILTAPGASGSDPDWLNQHAIDRGTSRRAGESDAALRVRLRSYPNALTRSAIMLAVTDVLTAVSVTDPAYMVELPRDQIFLTAVTGDAGTGGVFAGPTAGAMTFTPTVPFAYPPYLDAAEVSGRVRSHQIVISGAASGGNNGTFTVTGLSGNGVTYANGAGVAATDVGVGWATKRKDVNAVVTEGRQLCYLDRGDRVGLPRSGAIVIILPYGTPDAALSAISEMLRFKKAGGFLALVERRAIP